MVVLIFKLVKVVRRPGEIKIVHRHGLSMNYNPKIYKHSKQNTKLQSYSTFIKFQSVKREIGSSDAIEDEGFAKCVTLSQLPAQICPLHRMI